MARVTTFSRRRCRTIQTSIPPLTGAIPKRHYQIMASKGIRISAEMRYGDMMPGPNNTILSIDFSLSNLRLGTSCPKWVQPTDYEKVRLR